MHVEKNSWKLITLCWFKIMVITNMLSKKITLWGDDAMVNDLTLQCGGGEFKSPHLQSKLPRLLR
jgi:hypothetical protein